jgi:hypothetical protein
MRYGGSMQVRVIPLESLVLRTGEIQRHGELRRMLTRFGFWEMARSISSEANMTIVRLCDGYFGKQA